MSARILIAEDDQDIASTLSRGLAREGYDPVVSFDAAGAIAAARERAFDAAVVDMMLGPDRGEDLVRQLRAQGLDGPILILSALSGVEDRTEGLESGADDYIAKPFDFAELLARLRVQEARRSRRGRAAVRSGLQNADLRADLRRIAAGGREVTLTGREWDLLTYLVSAGERVVSRGEIFDNLWAREGGASENVVDVYIGYLRRKLAPTRDFGFELRTIRARGFLLTEKLDEEPSS